MAGLSKYFIAIFVIFYTFHCFAVFSYKNDEERRIFYVFQNVLMVLTHLLGFYVLYTRSHDSNMIILCVLEEILLFAMIVLFRMLYPFASRLITNNICMLLSISFVMLARLSYARAWRQFLIAAFGVVLALIIPHLTGSVRLIKKHYWIAGIIGLAILLVMMTIGSVTNGSKISLTIAGVTFLPSEFVRLLFIFFLAGLFTDEDQIDPQTGKPTIQQIAASTLIGGAYVGILAMCKDLGSALMFFVIYIFMLYVTVKAPLVLIGGVGGMAAASALGYRLFAHVRNRVRAWKDPFSDIEGAGYQVAQSIFAIGTGSWFGLGLMGGSPKSIPEVAKDFIFAAISEEMGGLVALCIILISMSNFLMFMNISMSISDFYLRLMAVGLAVNYGFQVILTIGGVTKFIPLTGITLPLVSYGGSSVLVTFVCFSIIQGLYVLSRQAAVDGEEEGYEDEDFYRKAGKAVYADRDASRSSEGDGRKQTRREPDEYRHHERAHREPDEYRHHKQAQREPDEYRHHERAHREPEEYRRHPEERPYQREEPEDNDARMAPEEDGMDLVTIAEPEFYSEIIYEPVYETGHGRDNEKDIVNRDHKGSDREDQ